MTYIIILKYIIYHQFNIIIINSFPIQKYSYFINIKYHEIINYVLNNHINKYLNFIIILIYKFK